MPLNEEVKGIKIKMIRDLRSYTDCGLKDAKDAIEAAMGELDKSPDDKKYYHVIKRGIQLIQEEEKNYRTLFQSLKFRLIEDQDYPALEWAKEIEAEEDKRISQLSARRNLENLFRNQLSAFAVSIEQKDGFCMVKAKDRCETFLKIDKNSLLTVLRDTFDVWFDEIR